MQLDSDQALDLTNSQKKALEHVLEKHNVFITGDAGAGKTLLIKLIRLLLEELKLNIAITSTTGVAALLIGGITLHSWAGIGVPSGSTEEIWSKFGKRKNIIKKFMEIDALIIDEVSLLNSDYFETLDYLAKRFRNDPRPFGGIQMILSGDFFQLPPVNSAKFVFETTSWSESGFKIINLNRIFRQKCNELGNILSKMRLGIVTDESTRILLSLDREIPGIEQTQATKLFPLSDQVNRVNQEQLDALEGECFNFDSEDIGDSTLLDKGLLACKRLSLKVGANVMLIRNYNSKLVNGSTGTIESISDSTITVNFPGIGAQALYRDAFTLNDSVNNTSKRIQFPLVLSYALTIHKAQGSQIRWLDVDLANSFAPGQVYVAISRAVSMDGLRIRNFQRFKVECNQKVLLFHQSIQ